MARPYKGHLLTEEQKKIVEENINFVWYYYGQRVSNRHSNINNTDKDEIISCLFFGLCLAAEKYDPHKGKFSTIASWYLRSEVSNYFRERGLFYNRYFLTPFIFDNELNSDADNIHGLSEEGYKKINRDGAIEEPEDVNSLYYEKIKWEDMEYIINGACLCYKEKTILSLFYRNGHTYKEISKIMGMSRERIRQINESSIEKIRQFINEIGIKKEDIVEYSYA